MSRISDILSAQQGRYEWRKRDCLATAHALIEGLLGKGRGPDYSEWHGLSEGRAIVTAINRYGSYGAGHVAVFGALDGMEVLEGDMPLEPGDIVWLAGEVEAGGEHWDLERAGGVLGFVGDSHEIFVFARPGLTPARGDYQVERIFRCRPR